MGTILQGIGDPVLLEEITITANKGGKATKVKPQLPSVVLADPKDSFNVGNVQRACANWGVGQLWWTGDRVTAGVENLDDVLKTERVRERQTKEERKKSRMPREERMKGWANVELINHQRPFDFYERMEKRPRIICVELLPGAQSLFHFEHPMDAVYVFGPEDGEVPDSIRHLCSDRVMAPTAGCMNLSAAVNVVLAFRRYSLIQQGLIEDLGADGYLTEHRGPL